MAQDAETFNSLPGTVGPFCRDVRLFRIYEGTSQIRQIIVAREMLRELRG